MFSGFHVAESGGLLSFERLRFVVVARFCCGGGRSDVACISEKVVNFLAECWEEERKMFNFEGTCHLSDSV